MIEMCVSVRYHQSAQHGQDSYPINTALVPARFRMYSIVTMD
jgi:hypothetical protein